MQRNIKGLAAKSRFLRAFCTSHFKLLGAKTWFFQGGGAEDGASWGDAGRHSNADLPGEEMICRGAGGGLLGSPGKVGNGRWARTFMHPISAPHN